MKVLFVIPSLGPGGAERVVATLAGELAARGHSVTVITTTTRKDHYRLAAGCERLAMNLSGTDPGAGFSSVRRPRAFLRLMGGLREFRKAVNSRSPDVVVSFMTDMNLLTLLVVGRRLPVVVSERSNPAMEPTRWAYAVLRRLLYPRAAGLVSPGAGMDAALSWLPSSKRTVIHNPVAFETQGHVPKSAGSQNEMIQFVAMGRLVYQKGFDLLLEAMSLWADRGGTSEWRLSIFGDGPDRDALVRQVKALGMEQLVDLPGVVANPEVAIANADVFVLSSRWEGFVNVVIEALATGVPVVAFDCDFGPSEIIHDGYNGLLVPNSDVVALTDALISMSDVDLRHRLASTATASVERFGAETIAQQWDEYLHQAIRRWRYRGGKVPTASNGSPGF